MGGSSRFHRPIDSFDGCRGFRRYLFGHFDRLLAWIPVPVSGGAAGRRLGVVLLLTRQVSREGRSAFVTPFLVVPPGWVFRYHRDWSKVLDGWILPSVDGLILPSDDHSEAAIFETARLRASPTPKIQF